MSSFDFAKTASPSLSDFFDALTLDLASAPSAPAAAKKSDEKAQAVVHQLSLGSTQRELHSARGSMAISTPAKAAASSKKIFTSILERKIPFLLKHTETLCSRQSNELAPPIKQSKEHETQTALQMCLGSYKACEPYIAHGEENSRKALHYRAIVNILFSELNFLNTIVKYLSSSIHGQYIQDLLFENLDITLSPDGGRYTLSIPIAEINLDDMENFAFYLRFNKPLEMVKDFAKALQLLQSQQEVLAQFKASANPGVLGLIVHLNSELEKIGRARFELVIGDLAKKLATMDLSFQSPYVPHLVRAISPSYGYLLCRNVQEFLKIIAGFDNGKVDPHLDRNNLAMQKKCFMDMLKCYLDKQIDIYACAFEKMQKLIEAKPAYKTTANFAQFDENPDIALYTPEQYKKKILELKKSIHSDLSNSFPINQSLQLIDASKKEEKKSDAVKSEAGKDVTPPVSSSVSDTKKKKNKKKKAPPSQVSSLGSSVSGSVLPAVTATTASPAVASSAVVATAASQKAPSQASVTVARPVDSKEHLLSFLSAPVKHYPHARVRRWLSINPHDLTKIRSFEDRSAGELVQKYKNLAEDELKLQLLLHGCTPLVDRILNDPAARKKYCYPTKSGLGMFVEVRTVDALDKGIKGVLFYGLDKSIYFHRKIDPLTMERIEQVSLSMLVDESAQTVLQNISTEPTKDELAEMEKEFQSEFVGDTVMPN